jgi:hypothetical protein
VELHFVAPVLAELDTLESEVIACSLWQDVRPSEGVAGLCDWRLGGRISRLLRRGLLTGEPGEVMMVPGRPRLGFDKILLFGAGERARFDLGRLDQIARHMLGTLEGLSTRIAVLELPGRQSDLVGAEQAADLLLAAARGARGRYDALTLVEDADGRRRIEQHLVDQRRRVRR